MKLSEQGVVTFNHTAILAPDDERAQGKLHHASTTIVMAYIFDVDTQKISYSLKVNDNQPKRVVSQDYRPEIFTEVISEAWRNNMYPGLKATSNKLDANQFSPQRHENETLQLKEHVASGAKCEWVVSDTSGLSLRYGFFCDANKKFESISPQLSPSLSLYTRLGTSVLFRHKEGI